jgi:hypothetical protein
MKVRIWMLATASALVLCPTLQSQTNSSPSSVKQPDTSVKAKKCTVKQLNGTKLFGSVEITDDYTIRVSNDWGIIRLPIAELDDARTFANTVLRKIGPMTDVFGTNVKRRLMTSRKIRNLKRM